MKKQFFTFLMMIALVIVAGKAMAQGSLSPYLGATYTYSVADIDPGSVAREVQIYMTTELNANMTIATDYVVSAGTIITSVGAASPFYVGTLPSGSTSFTFNVEYPSSSTLAIGTTYRLWIKIFDGTILANDCSNMKFLEITPAVNNFELAISAMTDACQIVALPTSENVMGSNGQYTEFTYDVEATGVGTGQNWRFTLTLDVTSMTYLATTNPVEFVSATATAGSGTITTTSTYSGGVVTLTAPATATTVQVKYRILTTPGATATFVGTLTNEQLMNTAATVALYTDDATGDNADVVLKKVPFIGNFGGVD